MVKITPPELIPVRILNEFVYCPRLAYIEWVQSEFVDNQWTVSGRFDHRRVDKKEIKRAIDESFDKNFLIKGRAVKISAPEFGLIGIIDMVEIDGNQVVPVDYKRGSKPNIEHGVWDTDKIQLCAQALMLEENGYHCEYGTVYYVQSKERVEVLFSECLRKETLGYIKKLREIAASGKIPPPLDESPKCNNCSLVTVCLPDEVHLYAHDKRANEKHPIRRLIPANTDRIPLYVHHQGAQVSKKGEMLIVRIWNEPDVEIRMMDISQVAVFGGVQVTTAAINSLCGHKIPLCYFSHGGWFYGVTTGLGHKNVDLRIHQYAAVENSDRALNLARRFVEDKIKNSRTLMRRNMKPKDKEVLKILKSELDRAKNAGNFESLLGYEGNAARIYFGSFNRMIRPSEDKEIDKFIFTNRNRRPPKDPINALLSFAYALLTKDMTVTLQSVGFDPYLGFYHSAKYGRPALALDMIEPFRSIIADSVVIGVINNSVLKSSDFVISGSGVNLRQKGRKKFLEAYERRLDTEIIHPVFGYKISYRQVMEVQARLLGRYLSKEIPEYPSFVVR